MTDVCKPKYVPFEIKEGGGGLNEIALQLPHSNVNVNLLYKYNTDIPRPASSINSLNSFESKCSVSKW